MLGESHAEGSLQHAYHAAMPSLQTWRGRSPVRVPSPGRPLCRYLLQGDFLVPWHKRAWSRGFPPLSDSCPKSDTAPIAIFPVGSGAWSPRRGRDNGSGNGGRHQWSGSVVQQHIVAQLVMLQRLGLYPAFANIKSTSFIKNYSGEECPALQRNGIFGRFPLSFIGPFLMKFTLYG